MPARAALWVGQGKKYLEGLAGVSPQGSIRVGHTVSVWWRVTQMVSASASIPRGSSSRSLSLEHMP